MKRVLSLRAECMVDMTRFMHLVEYANEAKFVADLNITYRICGVTLQLDVDNDELSLSYFKNIASNVPDGHTMLETMSFNGIQPRSYSSSDFRMSQSYHKLTCDVKMDI